MCYDVLMLSKNVMFLPFLMPLAVLHGCFPAECGMRDAVRGAALIPWLPLASRRPRCSPINTDSITMHPTSHSRCGPSAGGKREGEKQGERLSDRWSWEKMNTWQQAMLYSQTLLKLNVAFFVRDKGGITTCNKENPVAIKVNCSFSTATTPAEFRNSFQ